MTMTMTMPGFTAELSVAAVRGGGSAGVRDTDGSETLEPAGPLAYAACVALCAWWMGPACFAACIPLFVAPGP